MKYLICYRIAFTVLLVIVGYCVAHGRWVDVAGFGLAAGLFELAAWVCAERRAGDLEVIAGANARAVAKTRAVTLLDAVERDAPVAMRFGQHPASWLLGVKWTLDAARKVIKEGEL